MLANVGRTGTIELDASGEILSPIDWLTEVGGDPDRIKDMIHAAFVVHAS